jgi:hypothetical protein
LPPAGRIPVQTPYPLVNESQPSLVLVGAVAGETEESRSSATRQQKASFGQKREKAIRGGTFA